MARPRKFYVLFDGIRFHVQEGRPRNGLGQPFRTRLQAEEAACWADYSRQQLLADRSAAFEAERAEQRRQAARYKLAATLLERFLREHPHWPDEQPTSGYGEREPKQKYPPRHQVAAPVLRPAFSLARAGR